MIYIYIPYGSFYGSFPTLSCRTSRPRWRRCLAPGRALGRAAEEGHAGGQGGGGGLRNSAPDHRGTWPWGRWP